MSKNCDVSNDVHPKLTLVDDFRNKFPSGKFAKGGYPRACVTDLYPTDECCEDCCRCWNRLLEDIE